MNITYIAPFWDATGYSQAANRTLLSLDKTKNVLDMEPFANKWKNAGWEVKEIDGHNLEQLIKVLSSISTKNKKPTVIIANTIKGKGLRYMENTISSHYALIQKDKLEEVLKNIY